MPVRNASEMSAVHRISGPSRRPRTARAYTLTEVIAVIAIIAILATVVIGVGRYAMKRARLGKTRGTFHKLELAIGLYHKDLDGYIPDSVRTANGQSLQSVLAKINWPRRYVDPLGNRRSRPSLNDYDKPSEILFFFLQEMYDVMNQPGSRDANMLLLARLPRKEAYVKFKNNELRDTDGDLLPEIVDGWGTPFLYVCADRQGREGNVEPHADKNPGSFSLYSFGPDKLGYYRRRGTQRGELDYPVGDLDLDGKSDSSDESEMENRVREFARGEGYSDQKATEVLNKDNITNWERLD